MGGGDLVEASFGEERPKEPISAARERWPRGFWRPAGPRRRRPPQSQKSQPELFGLVAHKRLVAVRRLPAQLVIEVDQHQGESHLARVVAQESGKQHGVRPAGGGHTHPLPRPKPALPFHIQAPPGKDADAQTPLARRHARSPDRP